MVAVLLTVLILGVLILVHEMGHFFVARARRVRVETFSIGFGPRVFGIRRGETDYIISAVPFGGYVKMAGDDPERVTGQDDEFLSKPFRDRMLIILAGPVANFVLGFVFFLGASFMGVDYLPGNTIGDVQQDSPAWRSGFRPGDVLLKVNGKEFKDWSKLPTGKIDAQVLRNRDTLFIKDGQLDGVQPFLPAVLGKLVPGEPAEQAGLAQGDRVLMVDSLEVSSWGQMVDYIRQRPGQSISMTVLRGQDTLVFTLTPKEQSSLEAGKEKKIGVIGVLAPLKTRRLSPGEAVLDALFQTIYATGFIFMVLFKMLTGGISLSGVGGPIMMGKVVGQSWGLGLRQLLSTAALISVNLGVINLLPVPGLDGGHALIFSIEAIVRKRIPTKWHIRIQLAGLLTLAGLMIFITIMDVWRVFFK